MPVSSCPASPRSAPGCRTPDELTPFGPSRRPDWLRGDTPASRGHPGPSTVDGYVDVDDHRRVVGGLFALAGVAVDEGVGDPIGERVGQHHEVDPQAHVLVEVPGAIVPPGEQLVLVVTEAEAVDESPL